jgi:glycerophosphoryl diester phosphodiesterase
MRSGRTCLLVLVALLAVVEPAAAHDDDPLVIGHRGAPGYLPDHTLEGYALAIKMGADYIEPDLVVTKDGHLIARHEPNISGTTDVEAKFPGCQRDAIVDGAPERGCYASDFTLAQIRTLRARQPLPAIRPTQFDGKFKIPTFDEVLTLAKKHRVGVYPETKHPTYHKQLGLPIEGRLVRALDRAGLNHKRAKVFIQSFEQSNLKQLNRMTDVPLVQLVDAADVAADGSLVYYAPWDRPYDWTVSGDPRLLARTFAYFATDAGLREISTYADGIGPWKTYIVSTRVASDGSRVTLPPTDLIRRAHRKGLLIHTWTFRNEDQYLAADYDGNPLKEYRQFFRLGIDGVFSDFPDTAVFARWLYG